jgi:hypothetical protein
MTINDHEYYISIKMLSNDAPQPTQITIEVRSEKNLFSMEVDQIDLSEAHAALNEVMCLFRALTGLPMATVPGQIPSGPFPVAVPPAFASADAITPTKE